MNWKNTNFTSGINIHIAIIQQNLFKYKWRFFFFAISNCRVKNKLLWNQELGDGLLDIESTKCQILCYKCHIIYHLCHIKCMAHGVWHMICITGGCCQLQVIISGDKDSQRTNQKFINYNKLTPKEYSIVCVYNTITHTIW